MTEQEKILAIEKDVDFVSFFLECGVCYNVIGSELSLEDAQKPGTIGIALHEEGARYVENGRIEDNIVQQTTICADCFKKLKDKQYTST